MVSFEADHSLRVASRQWLGLFVFKVHKAVAYSHKESGTNIKTGIVHPVYD